MRTSKASQVCLSVACGVMTLLATTCVPASEVDDRPFYDVAGLEKDQAWVAIRENARIDVLRMLAQQTKGNYERLDTWQGAYDVKVYQLVTPDVSLQRALASSAQKVEVDSQKFEGALKFNINLRDGKIFTSKNTSSMFFLSKNDSKPITVPGTGPLDGQSILTAEHYIHFDPKPVFPAFTYLPDHPDAKMKRAAFREDAGRGKKLYYGDALDPRGFFRCDTRSAVWEEIDVQAGMLSGKYGAEILKTGSDRVKVSELRKGGDTWYRVRCKYSASRGADRMPGADLTVVSYWCSSVGFSPVARVASFDEEGTKLHKRTDWVWKEVDGIYVPSRVREESFADRKPHKVVWSRESRLTDCVLNQPVSDAQFELSALGMRNGDLIIDKVNRAVYKFADGKEVKLGNFGDRSGSTPKWSKVHLLVTGNLVLLGAYLASSRYRRKKQKTSDGGDGAPRAEES